MLYGMQAKQALWMGGIQRSNPAVGKSNTPGLQNWTDLVRANDLLSRQAVKLSKFEMMLVWLQTCQVWLSKAMSLMNADFDVCGPDNG